MCRFKSAIVLKDRVFVADYDHHTQMLEELKIEDNRRNAENLFVRVELIPKNNDYFSDIDTWELNVDQDIIPEWFIEEVDRPRVMNAIKLWAKNRIFIGVDNLDLNGGVYYLKNCKCVTARNNSTVTAWDNSTVTARGNSTVTAMGNSTVIKTQYSSFKKDNLVLCDNSTFKDCSTKTIYQSGDWKLEIVN